MLSSCSRRGTTPVLAVLRAMALNPEVPRPLLLTPHTLPPALAAGLARTAAFAPTWHCIAGTTACAIPERTGCPPFPLKDLGRARARRRDARDGRERGRVAPRNYGGGRYKFLGSSRREQHLAFAEGIGIGLRGLWVDERSLALAEHRSRS